MASNAKSIFNAQGANRICKYSFVEQVEEGKGSYKASQQQRIPTEHHVDVFCSECGVYIQPAFKYQDVEEPGIA
ncbi:hypothetical protein PG996_001451 [Apiospora saccharicola]|uniref:CENP-V/GFA domain-containing protein n=1 Tax=Apiospora saccharicola TaxID=335842 RepID=A0ABR1WJJ3_9PEZI